MLNINVRVAATQANQALQQVQQQIRTMQKQVATPVGGAGGGMFGGAMGHLDRFGKQLQWTGRQLEFSFTLPLLLAGGAATKWALDNERAMVQVQKVYGDGTESAAQLRGELDALTKTFELLSSRFGVNQKEVIEIGGAWAQAGSAGVGLARATKLTLETMILGQLDAAKATEGLIGIQSAYRLNTQELTAAVADLNRIENQTGITLGGLIDVVARAGGTAKTAGIPINQLAAYAAALVPAAGSAAQAGNALRTMISRIMAPTRESSELLAQMGINIFEASWQSQDAVGRIKTLADKFVGLSDAQKTVVSSSIASRWQLNRFDLLMDQVANNTGFYARGMDTVRDSQDKLGGSTKAQIQMQRELLTALESNPQQLSILTNVLKNTLATAIQPIIPYLIIMVNKIAQLAKGFQNLSPQVKQIIAGGLIFLALLGPLTRYVGAFALLISTMGKSFLFLNRHLIGTAGHTGVFTKIWAKSWIIIKDIAVSATLRIMYLIDALNFKIKASWAASSTFIARIWGAAWQAVATVLRPVGSVLVGAVAQIGTAINTVWAASIGAMALPPAAMALLVIGAFALMIAWVEEHVPGGFHAIVKSIANALGALPRVVGNVFVAVARTIRSTLSQIYEMIQNALNPFRRHSPSLVDNVIAGVDVILSQYKKLSRIPSLLRGAASALAAFKNAAGDQGQEVEFQRQRAEIVAVSPNAGPAVDALWDSLKGLRAELILVQSELTQQEVVVDRWEKALDRANDTLKQSELELDRLQQIARVASDALADAKTELDRLRDIDLQGWNAMDDAIFANQMAIKELELAILDMEDAGLSVDDLTSRLSSLQGAIEMLQGEAADLRNAGAGSDVLGPIEDQIRLLEDQRQAIQEQGTPINDLQKKLEELQRKGQILDLERALQFDPLTRQLETVGRSMQELPFAELYAQLVAQQQVVDTLTTAYEGAEAAVTAQQATVDQHKAARDELQKTYEAEKAILDNLKDAYSVIEGAIRDMESSLNDAASAAARMAAALEDTRSQAEMLFDAGQGFEFPDVGGVTDIGREGGLFDIEAFNKQMEEDLAKTLKDMDFKIDLFQPIKDQFKRAWDWIKKNSTKLIVGALLAIPAAVLLGITGIPALIFTVIMAGLTAIFGDKIREWFEDRFGQAVDAVQWVVERIVGFFIWLYDTLIGNSIIPDLINGIIDWFASLPGKLLGLLGDAVTWLAETGADIVRGLWNGIKGFIGNVWDFFKDLPELIFKLVLKADLWLIETGKDIVRGLVNGLKNVVGEVWDFITGIPQGIWTIVSGAWDWLRTTGHDIIWGLIYGLGEFLGNVWDFIKSIPEGLWSFFSNAAGWLVNAGKGILIGLWNGIASWLGTFWDFLRGVPQGIWNFFGNAADWLKNAGINLIIGLWNGFAGWLGNFWDRIRGFAGDLIGYLGGLFRLGSPSRVFMDMGQMLAQGLAIGMMNETDQVKNAAQALANAAIPNMSDISVPGMSFGDMLARGSFTGSTFPGTSSSVTSMNSSESREVHIHGNLEFPNISDAGDAEAFIRNLGALADG